MVAALSSGLRAKGNRSPPRSSRASPRTNKRRSERPWISELTHCWRQQTANSTNRACTCIGRLHPGDRSIGCLKIPLGVRWIRLKHRSTQIREFFADTIGLLKLGLGFLLFSLKPQGPTFANTIHIGRFRFHQFVRGFQGLCLHASNPSFMKHDRS